MVKVCLLVRSMKAKFDLIRWKLEIDVGAQFVAYWDHDNDALILAFNRKWNENENRKS